MAPVGGADKFDAQCRKGVWLGLDIRTDENIMGTSYGIYKTAPIKGMPEDKRWDSAKALAVVGMPWDPTPNVDAEDGARLPNPEAADTEIIPKDPKIIMFPNHRFKSLNVAGVHLLDRLEGSIADCQDVGVTQVQVGSVPIDHDSFLEKRAFPAVRIYYTTTKWVFIRSGGCADQVG